MLTIGSPPPAVVAESQEMALVYFKSLSNIFKTNTKVIYKLDVCELRSLVIDFSG